MCDSNLRILDLVARWPGSCHDSTIFSNSRICSRFEYNEFGNNVVVADGGYPSKSYIMTPLRTCSTAAQRLYNVAQISTRNPIERLFGVWKRRFPVLALGLRVKMSTVQSIIVATGILHNICREQMEFHVPPLDEFDEEQVRLTLNIDNGDSLATDDVGTRREAIIEYFANMTS